MSRLTDRIAQYQQRLNETVTPNRARQLAEGLGVNWNRVRFTASDLASAIKDEAHHNLSTTDTAKIALERLLNDPDYYKKEPRAQQEEVLGRIEQMVGQVKTDIEESKFDEFPLNLSLVEEVDTPALENGTRFWVSPDITIYSTNNDTEHYKVLNEGLRVDDMLRAGWMRLVRFGNELDIETFNERNTKRLLRYLVNDKGWNTELALWIDDRSRMQSFYTTIGAFLNLGYFNASKFEEDEAVSTAEFYDFLDQLEHYDLSGLRSSMFTPEVSACANWRDSYVHYLRSYLENNRDIDAAKALIIGYMSIEDETLGDNCPARLRHLGEAVFYRFRRYIVPELDQFDFFSAHERDQLEAAALAGNTSYWDDNDLGINGEDELLIARINRDISRRTKYGLRQERINYANSRIILWNNAQAKWYIARRRGKIGDVIVLDANEVLVYARKAELEKVLPWLDGLPLYQLSTEAGKRGIVPDPDIFEHVVEEEYLKKLLGDEYDPEDDEWAYFGDPVNVLGRLHVHPARLNQVPPEVQVKHFLGSMYKLAKHEGVDVDHDLEMAMYYYVNNDIGNYKRYSESALSNLHQAIAPDQTFAAFDEPQYPPPLPLWKSGEESVQAEIENVADIGINAVPVRADFGAEASEPLADFLDRYVPDWRELDAEELAQELDYLHEQFKYEIIHGTPESDAKGFSNPATPRNPRLQPHPEEFFIRFYPPGTASFDEPTYPEPKPFFPTYEQQREMSEIFRNPELSDDPLNQMDISYGTSRHGLGVVSKRPPQSEPLVDFLNRYVPDWKELSSRQIFDELEYLRTQFQWKLSMRVGSHNHDLELSDFLIVGNEDDVQPDDIEEKLADISIVYFPSGTAAYDEPDEDKVFEELEEMGMTPNQFPTRRRPDQSRELNLQIEPAADFMDRYVPGWRGMDFPTRMEELKQVREQFSFEFLHSPEHYIGGNEELWPDVGIISYGRPVTVNAVKYYPHGTAAYDEPLPLPEQEYPARSAVKHGGGMGLIRAVNDPTGRERRAERELPENLKYPDLTLPRIEPLSDFLDRYLPNWRSLDPVALRAELDELQKVIKFDYEYPWDSDERQLARDWEQVEIENSREDLFPDVLRGYANPVTDTFNAVFYYPRGTAAYEEKEMAEPRYYGVRYDQLYNIPVERLSHVLKEINEDIRHDPEYQKNPYVQEQRRKIVEMIRLKSGPFSNFPSEDYHGKGEPLSVPVEEVVKVELSDGKTYNVRVRYHRNPQGTNSNMIDVIERWIKSKHPGMTWVGIDQAPYSNFPSDIEIDLDKVHVVDQQIFDGNFREYWFSPDQILYEMNQGFTHFDGIPMSSRPTQNGWVRITYYPNSFSIESYDKEALFDYLTQDYMKSWTKPIYVNGQQYRTIRSAIDEAYSQYGELDSEHINTFTIDDYDFLVNWADEAPIMYLSRLINQVRELSVKQTYGSFRRTYAHTDEVLRNLKEYIPINPRPIAMEAARETQERWNYVNDLLIHLDMMAAEDADLRRIVDEYYHGHLEEVDPDEIQTLTQLEDRRAPKDLEDDELLNDIKDAYDLVDQLEESNDSPDELMRVYRDLFMLKDEAARRGISFFSSISPKVKSNPTPVVPIIRVNPHTGKEYIVYEPGAPEIGIKLAVLRIDDTHELTFYKLYSNQANIKRLIDASELWEKQAIDIREKDIDIRTVLRAQFASDAAWAAARFLGKDQCCTIVALDKDEKVEGLGVYQIARDRSALISLVVIAPIYQPGYPYEPKVRGIGTTITCEIAKDLVDNNVRSVCLKPLDEAAREFWERRGFRANRNQLCITENLHELALSCERPDCPDEGDNCAIGSMVQMEYLQKPEVRQALAQYRGEDYSPINRNEPARYREPIRVFLDREVFDWKSITPNQLAYILVEMKEQGVFKRLRPGEIGEPSVRVGNQRFAYVEYQ